MYYIMNNALSKVIGTLDLTGGKDAKNWFMTDEIHEELASEDSQASDSVSVSEVTSGNNKGWNSYVTLTIPKTSSYFNELTTTGNHVLHQFEDHLQCYRITDVEIDSTGYKATITAYNLALFNLKHTTPEAKTFDNASSQTVFEYLFSKTGWQILTNQYTGGVANYEVDGKSTANTLLQTALQTFDCEMRAYVEVVNGVVANKYIEICDKLGSETTGKRIEYGWNATGITKKVTDGALITKLYVIGKDNLAISGTSGVANSFIVDDEANDKYNSASSLYLEGVATNDEITDGNALLEWGQKLLKYYNHPRANYTVTVSSDFEANIGDTVRVIDDTINLTLASRVIQKVMSEATPTSNQITLGEFVTVKNVTPAAIDALESKMNQTTETIAALNKAINDASTITIAALTPDGTDFADNTSSKRLIMVAREGTTNISPYIEKAGWQWRNTQTDARKYGYLVNVDAGQGELGTWRAQVNTDYLTKQSEYDVDTKNFSVVGSYTPWTSDNTSEIGHVGQCCVQMPDGNYITSHGLGGSTDDTAYCLRDSNFKLKSKMVVKYGGHGTNFGAYYDTVSGQYMLIIARKSSDKKRNYITKVAYQAGQTLDETSKTFNNIIIDSHYMTAGGNEDYLMYKIGDTCKIIPSENLASGQSEADASKLATYSVNIKNAGLDTVNDNYQSVSLDYPWVYWCSGNQNGTPNRINAVNAIHGGRCFRYTLDFGSLKHDYDGGFEIQSMSINPAGDAILVQAVNYASDANKSDEKGHCTEYIYEFPLIKREDSDPVDLDSLGGDDE